MCFHRRLTAIRRQELGFSRDGYHIIHFTTAVLNHELYRATSGRSHNSGSDEKSDNTRGLTTLQTMTTRRLPTVFRLISVLTATQPKRFPRRCVLHNPLQHEMTLLRTQVQVCQQSVPFQWGRQPVECLSTLYYFACSGTVLCITVPHCLSCICIACHSGLDRSLHKDLLVLTALANATSCVALHFLAHVLHCSSLKRSDALTSTCKASQ